MKKVINYIAFIILFPSSISCRYDDKQSSARKIIFSSNQHIIPLKNQLGSIKMQIPHRFDTVMFWTRYSDCTSCGEEKIRFQKKSDPIFLESGFYWVGDPKDSIDQLTIEYPRYIEIRDSISDEIVKRNHRLNLTEAGLDPVTSPIASDTIKAINGKLFSIIISDNYDSLTKKFNKIVMAWTLHRGNNLRFIFRNVSSKIDSSSQQFISETQYILSTIEIDTSFKN